MYERLARIGRQMPDAQRQAVIDATIVLLVIVAILAEVAEADSMPGAEVVVMAGIGVAALLVRRRHPVPVLIVAVVARLFVMASTGSGLALLPVVAVALYTVARHGDRRTGLLVSGGAALLMSIIGAGLGDDSFLAEFLEEGAQAFLPIAVADALRTREDRIRDMIDAESEARVQAERLRIARDLHDVVAHGLSTIAIQSGVAARLLDNDTEQAREALEAINATGRESLEELRSMVGALRSTDVAAVQPTPADPDDISDVVATAERAGVRVDVQSHGSFPEDVSDAVVVAVHRIVQESLMNVARHAGPVPASVRLTHAEQHVDVEVLNRTTAAERTDVPSTGVGIVGMRERAESVGGSLSAAAEGQGFRVEARIPYGGHRHDR